MKSDNTTQKEKFNLGRFVAKYTLIDTFILKPSKDLAFVKNIVFSLLKRKPIVIELFDNAVKINKWTDEDLKQFQKSHLLISKISIAFALTSLIVCAFVAKDAFNVFLYASSSSIAFGFYLKHSFKAYQIEIRQLCTFKTYIKQNFSFM